MKLRKILLSIEGFPAISQSQAELISLDHRDFFLSEIDISSHHYPCTTHSPLARGFGSFVPKMADMDEDVARLPSNDTSTHIETDLSDETQDFRMLNHISLSVLLRETSITSY